MRHGWSRRRRVRGTDLRANLDIGGVDIDVGRVVYVRRQQARQRAVGFRGRTDLMLAEGSGGIKRNFHTGFHVERDQVLHAPRQSCLWNHKGIPTRQSDDLGGVHHERMVHSGRPVNGRPESGAGDRDSGDINLDRCSDQAAPGRREPAVRVDPAREIQTRWTA